MATKRPKDAQTILIAQEKRHMELISLIDYPPFSEMDDGSTSLDYDGVNPNWGFPRETKIGAQIMQAIEETLKNMAIEAEKVDGLFNVDTSMLSKMWNDVYSEFEDEINEARLYQKRYPEDRVEALIAAYQKK